MSIAPADFVIATLKKGSSAEMAVNGSATPSRFEHKVPAGKTLSMSGFQGVFLYRSGQSFNAEAPFLSPGLEVYLKNDTDSLVLDFLCGAKVERLGQLATYTGPLHVACDGQMVAFDWDFRRQLAGGTLDVPAGYRLTWKVNSNLTTYFSSIRVNVLGWLSDA